MVSSPFPCLLSTVSLHRLSPTSLLSSFLN
jgi:hypothetical protein